MKKTKRMPKMIAFLLAAIMLLSATPISALATGVDSVINTSITGSITLYKQDADNNNPIEGVGYTLYQVATIKQTTENGNSVTTFNELYTPNDWYTIQSGTYAGQQVYMPEIDEINSLNSYKFNTLVIAALEDMGVITIIAEQTSGTDGKIVFSTLDSGFVYLAVETTTPSGTTAANNFLITVPMYYAAGTTFTVDITLPNGSPLTAGDSLAEDMWIYDVVAFPKNNIDASTTKKTYVDGKEVNSVEYGQVFTYEVTTSIPNSLYPYLESDGTTVHYYDSYVIKDTAGKNIEYVLTSGTVDATVTLWNGSDPSNPVVIRELVAGTDYVLAYDDTSNSFGIELIDQSYDFSNPAAGDITSYYDDSRGGYQDGDYLVITYDAIIVDNDKTNTSDTTNTVDIDTDGSDGEYKIPGTEKNTETYDYKVWKVGEDNDDTHNYDYVGLKGAEFALMDTAGNYMGLYAYDVVDGTGATITKYEWVTFDNETAWKNKELAQSDSTAYSNGNTTGTVTTIFTSDEYGLFKLEGLAAGTYKLMEVTAPDGYTLLADAVEITVGAESDAKANTTLSLATIEEVNEALDRNKNSSSYFSIYIINKSTGEGGNWTLPTTGDMGIGIFIIIGGVLIMAAIGLYAYNKKKNNSANKA